MNWKNTPQRYSTVLVALHWLMLILLVAVYASMELRGLAPRGSTLRGGLTVSYTHLTLPTILRV